MKRMTLAPLIFVLCFLSMGAGYIFGGTNLGFAGYPEFDSREPHAPYSREKYSIESYRDDVEKYVKNAKEYVENAENDKIRIDSAIEEAIDKANKAVKNYNDWVEFGY